MPIGFRRVLNFAHLTKGRHAKHKRIPESPQREDADSEDEQVFRGHDARPTEGRVCERGIAADEGTKDGIWR